MTKEEIEEKGYIYIEERNRYQADWEKDDYYSKAKGIIVYKDGYYGVLDLNTGEEISPCVHLNGTDAINDVYILNLRSKKAADRKLVSVQKVLKDNLGELYDPYTGSVVRLMFDIFGFPNGVYYIRDWSGCKLNEETFVKTALRLYESVAKIMKNGGKKLLIYSYDITKEILEYGREMEKVVNGEFEYRVIREYKTLTKEEEEKVYGDEQLGEKLDNYVDFIPALYNYVELRKAWSNPMNTERTDYYNMQKPCIEIGPDVTTYYPDLHENEKNISFVREEFKKEAVLEIPREK